MDDCPVGTCRGWNGAANARSSWCSTRTAYYRGCIYLVDGCCGCACARSIIHRVNGDFVVCAMDDVHSNQYGLLIRMYDWSIVDHWHSNDQHAHHHWYAADRRRRRCDYRDAKYIASVKRSIVVDLRALQLPTEVNVDRLPLSEDVEHCPAPFTVSVACTLNTAEWHVGFCTNRWSVDVGDTCFDITDRCECCVDIARIDARREPVR